MNHLLSNRIVGVAMGATSAQVAELSRSGDSARVTRAAEFAFPPGVDLSRPVELGRALRAFLRANGFAARDAAIGLPAKWLLTRRKEMPPAAPAAAAGMLRLQAETEFSGELAALSVDVAGSTSATEPSTVLLVATAKSSVERCVAMGRAAGLSVRTITATGAALSRATALTGDQDGVILGLAAGGAELVVRQHGVPTQLRHVPMPETGEMVSPLAGELKRTLAALPRNGQPATVTIWNARGLGMDAAALSRRLATPVTTPALREMAASDAPGDAACCAPAVAVALAGMHADAAEVNFLTSRLAPPPSTPRRTKILAGITAAVVVIGMVYMCVSDLQRKRADLAGIEQRYAAIEPDARRAEQAATRLLTARSYFAGQPRVLACLAEITAMFPDDRSFIATTLNIRGDLTGTLVGKAGGDEQILRLVDRMKSSKAFADAKLVESRDATSRTGREVTFTISFALREPVAKPVARTAPVTTEAGTQAAPTTAAGPPATQTSATAASTTTAPADRPAPATGAANGHE